MTRNELEVKRDVLQRALNELPEIKCESCQHHRRGVCGLANETIPEDVKKAGCPAWVWDGVPF